jgi:hypothetical protein
MYTIYHFVYFAKYYINIIIIIISSLKINVLKQIQRYDTDNVLTFNFDNK